MYKHKTDPELRKINFKEDLWKVVKDQLENAEKEADQSRMESKPNNPKTIAKLPE